MFHRFVHWLTTKACKNCNQCRAEVVADSSWQIFPHTNYECPLCGYCWQEINI